MADLDASPGFRRRFRIIPSAERVTAAVEDDYHCMAVTLHHDGRNVLRVESQMNRAPWTTCPGAPAVLKRTFEGVALADVARRGEKQANCTHLHDLALLAAAHAGDARAMQYDILASDPEGGLVIAEIRRDGVPVLKIAHRADVIEEPEAIRGASLFKLRPWIEGLEGDLREAARLLQWGAIIAHGRSMPLARQSDARKMPPNCYTFQPENAQRATRVGKIVDFSDGSQRAPLDRFDGACFRPANLDGQSVDGQNVDGQNKETVS